MTIPSSVRRAGPYTGTGLLATYPFSFKVFTTADIAVSRTDLSGATTLLTLTTDYTVALNADQTASPGGTITLVAGNLATGYLLTTVGASPYSQTTQLPNGGAYNAAIVEQMADKLEVQIQQVAESDGRALKFPTGSSASPAIPTPTTGFLYWAGTALAWASSFVQGALTVTAYIQTLLGAADATAARAILGAEFAKGQCRLTKSGLNLLLSPFNGNRLTINGVNCTIPAAGVSLVPSGLTAATAYYIYAVATAGVVTSLEASVTVPVADTVTVGVKIKTGDATRTLVGQAVATSATVWSVSPLYVLSYFNRRALTDKSGFTTSRTNSSTYPVYSETNSEIRVNFIAWVDDVPQFVFAGFGTNAISNGLAYSAIGIDSTVTAEEGGSLAQAYAAGAIVQAVNPLFKAVSEATLHYATQLGSNTSANTTWSGAGTPVARSSLQVTLQG